jgi:hypothetical protein
LNSILGFSAGFGSSFGGGAGAGAGAAGSGAFGGGEPALKKRLGGAADATGHEGRAHERKNGFTHKDLLL